MIKAVSFDLWFTIIYTNPIMDQKVNEIRKVRLTKLFEQYKIPIKPDEIIPCLMRAKRVILKEKMEQGYIDFSNRYVQIPRVWEHMLAEIDPTQIKYDSKEKAMILNSFHTIITTALLELNPFLVPNVEYAIKFTKDQGLKLGIISNTGLTGGESLRKVLAHYGLIHLFEALIFSDEAEVIKPNPKIFELLSAKLDLHPSEIVHIGDTIETDIVGARKSGYHEGVLFLGVFDDQYQSRHLEEEFKEFKPHFVIDDYSDLPLVLSAMNKGKHSFRSIHNKELRKRLDMY